jgi:hypothetical protein
MHLKREDLAVGVTDCDLHGSHGLVRVCMRFELTGTDFVVFEEVKGDPMHILCALEDCWDRLRAGGLIEEIGP